MLETNTVAVSAFIGAKESDVVEFLQHLPNLDSWTLFSRMLEQRDPHTWLGTASCYQDRLYYHVKPIVDGLARIIESVVKRLKIPPQKMFVNIDKYGNTSAASIAIALDEALTYDHLQPGDLIILVAFGAGLTWAVNLIRL